MLKQFAYSSLIYLCSIELIQPPGNVLSLVIAKTQKFVNTFEKMKVVWRKNRRGRNHGL